MDSNSNNVMTAEAHREQFSGIFSRSIDWDRDSSASTAIKTPTRAGTKSSEATPDDSAVSDSGYKSSSKKRTATRASLEESERLEALPATPYAAFPSPPAKRPRSMSNSLPATPYAAFPSPPAKRPRSMSDSPRAPSPLPMCDKMDAMLVVGRENYSRFGMSHKGQSFYISPAAIARVAPTLMVEIADYYSSDEESSNGETVIRPVTLPTGKPVWYLSNENAQDMKVLLDVIHGNETAVAASLSLVTNPYDRLPKAWRVARLAEKYNMAHELQRYVRLWFNSLKQNLYGEEAEDFLEIHKFLNKAAIEERKTPANKWGITAPETPSSSQSLTEHSSESEAESRDLADIHAENVRNAAAAEGSETTLSSYDNLPLRSRRLDARTDHY